MRLPSLHQNEEVVSPGESDAFVQGRSCAASLLTKAGSLRFDLIGFQGETHDGNRRPIATSLATRGSTRVDRLHCEDVDAPGTASGIASLSRPETRYGRSGAVTCFQAPGGTFIRRPPSDHATHQRSATLQHVVADRPALPQRPRSRAPTPAAGHPTQMSLWHARYLRRTLIFLRFCRRSPSKLLAMSVGTICLPIGMPPAFSIFWWISPSFCLSS